MDAFSMRARWVLPMDGPPLDGGCVTVVDGRIARVGRSLEGGACEDLGDVVLMPGLVNAHTHLEFSDLAAPLGVPGMSLPAWIRLVIAQRKRSVDETAAAVAAGLAECLNGGVTTVGEICASPTADSLASAAVDSPAVLSFQECIGFSGMRVDSAFANLMERFDAAAAAGAAVGFSPHAPYTVHPRLVELIADAAATREALVAMHLAESREELQLLRDGDGEFRALLEERSMWDADAIAAGARPLDYLHQLTRAPRSLVIHGNYLDAEEIALVGAHRATMSVVYCPRTHAYFGHDRYPLAALRAAGARVVLGTDSRASSPDLSLLAEVRYAARHFPEITAVDWVRMATVEAAAALGREGSAGSLSVGRAADMVAIACSPGMEAEDAVALGSGDIAGVWLSGRRVRPAG